MKRILIVGASSFIGSNLAIHLRSRHQIIGTYAYHKPWLDDVQLFRLDLHPQCRVQEVTRDLKVDVVIYCAACIDERKCEENPQLAEYINTDAPYLLARMFIDNSRGKFIYLSSSKVFSGTKGNYDEEEVRSPQSRYGLSKLRTEEQISPYDRTFIFRLGTVYGLGGSWHLSSVLNRILGDLWVNKPIQLITDEYRSFLSVEDICRAIELAIDAPDEQSGTYHLAPTGKNTYYEFAEAVTSAFGLKGRKLIPIPGAKFDGDFAAAGGSRGNDLTLSSKLFSQEFGYRFTGLEEGLSRFREKLRYGKQ